MTGQSVIRMRRTLTEAIPQPPWPEGIRLVPFDPKTHPPLVHALLASAYALGGGAVKPLAEWWSDLESNPEYDPALCLIAENEKGEVVGVAQCRTSAFVKDLAVDRAWRRRGLGAALLQEVFRTFQSRGAKAVDLKVLSDNPSGAIRLYERLGMRVVD